MSGRLKSPPSRETLFLLLSRMALIYGIAIYMYSVSCMLGGLYKQLSEMIFLGPI